MIRLVATDLDGTLLDPSGQVSERTRRVLLEVESRGIVVVFVTGRPVRWMEDLWHHVGDHGLAICSNGAIEYDVTEHRILRAHTIPRELGLRAADLIRTALPGSVFALEHTGGFSKEPGFMPSDQDATRPELTVGPLEELFGDDVVKLLAFHGEATPDDYWTRVERLVGHDVTTTWSATGALVEMSAAGVSKASTLTRICTDRGIAPEEVLAFGDMPNDIPMFEWAGTSYAMGNAHPSAVAAATHTAPGNDVDGVATVLEELFGL